MFDITMQQASVLLRALQKALAEEDGEFAFFSGSAVTCSPPVTDTDVDIFALHTGRTQKVLEDLGFKMDGNPEYDSNDAFTAYRKNSVNCILVDCDEQLEAIRVATDLCKFLNLKEKNERVAVFNALQHGVVSTERHLG